MFPGSNAHLRFQRKVDFFKNSQSKKILFPWSLTRKSDQNSLCVPPSYCATEKNIEKQSWIDRSIGKAPRGCWKFMWKPRILDVAAAPLELLRLPPLRTQGLSLRQVGHGRLPGYLFGMVFKGLYKHTGLDIINWHVVTDTKVHLWKKSSGNSARKPASVHLDEFYWVTLSNPKPLLCLLFCSDWCKPHIMHTRTKKKFKFKSV